MRKAHLEHTTESVLNERKPTVVIPARGGSKGILRKNIRSLNGLPLIAYTIHTALAAEKLGRVVLCTDDQEIADIGLEFGAEVPLLRSAKTATDTATVGAAITEMLQYYAKNEGPVFNFMVLYPTSPFRTPALLDFMADKLHEGYKKASTVFPVDMPGRAFHTQADRLTPTRISTPSSTTVRHCGSVSGSSRIGVIDNTYYHVLNNPIEQIDIDNHKDLQLAEFVLKNRLYKFNVPELDKTR